MNLSAWLIGMVGPLMARWLTAAGLTLVSVTGAVVAFDTLKGMVVDNIGGLPADAVQLGGLFGLWEAAGLVLGAFAFVLTWRQTSGFWKLARK